MFVIMFYESYIYSMRGRSNETRGQTGQCTEKFTPTRRAVLAAGCGIALSWLAGCSSAGDRNSTDSRDGAGTTTQVPGAGDFFFEFDDGDGTLTISFLGRATPPANQLEIQGENIGGVSGAWINLPGAEASETVNGTQALGREDSVTLGGAETQGPVGSNYVVELVFISKDGTRSIIASNYGPDV